MTGNDTESLTEWGQQVAALDSATRGGILAALGRLSHDGRISKADRDFACAQVDAIRRAVRQATAKKRKSPKSRKNL